MENLVIIIYLIGLLDSIVAAYGLAMLVAVVAFLVWAMVIDSRYSGDKQASWPAYKARLKVTGIGFAIATFIILLLPSSSTAYKMLAAYGVSEAYIAASQSEDIQRIAGKSLQLLEQEINKHLIEDKE